MTLLQTLHSKMLAIRMIEEEIARRYPEQKMRCPVHLSIGQEAAAVGVGEALSKSDDKMVSTHRGHAHYLAKGGSVYALLAELYGKSDGCSRGQGGSMHLVDRSVGFAGSTSIVGGTIPIGVGLAFAKKIKREPGVVVVCLGDAAIEEGVFHESANFASLHKLPVIFALENNFYSCYTHLKKRQPDRSLFHVAQAHDMGYQWVDGNSVMEVYRAAEIAKKHASEHGPYLLGMETYRYLEHCGPNEDDALEYRNIDEVKKWKTRDPLTLSAQELERCGEFSSEMKALRWDIKEDLDLLFMKAENAPFPEQSELGKFLYASS